MAWKQINVIHVQSYICKNIYQYQWWQCDEEEALTVTNKQIIACDYGTANNS